MEQYLNMIVLLLDGKRSVFRAKYEFYLIVGLKIEAEPLI